MLFNSLEFALFLPIVFTLYWFVFSKDKRIQNAFIVLASYLFYGWWDWTFLSLILLSTLVDFNIGRALAKRSAPKTREILLLTSIIVNLGLLGFFKYYNFFVESFIDAFSFFGVNINGRTLNIILPVGISFYTFQTLSYTIDVYRGRLEPTKDFIAFSAFVCFFPQLVAGPIERATNLLPQFHTNRIFDYHKAVEGMRQILWGLVKKVVIADNCAEFADIIFATYPDQNGSTLWLGAVFFTFQIYGDFSGYSDMAIGTSKLFGFDLKRNFATPYFSRDIAEFWRRWHISLSTWFRDYLYIPLGGSKGSTLFKLRNTFIIFLVSGFWHGANWTFVAWGAINALYFVPLLLTKRNRTHIDIVAKGDKYPTIQELFQMLTTFFITVVAWVFFRSDSIKNSFEYLSIMFSKTTFEAPFVEQGHNAMMIAIYLAVFIIIEWRNRESEFSLKAIKYYPKILQYTTFSILAYLVYSEQMKHSIHQFIYFQF